MSQYAMFALVVIIGLVIFPVGFEITQRISVWRNQIPTPINKFMGGRKFLRWRDFNVHKYGDTLGMVPMIGFVVLACREAQWKPLATTYAVAIYLLAALGACLWAISVKRAIDSGKINRYDWGFACRFVARITIAGYYHTFVTGLRFAAIGLAAIFVISGSASDTLTLCMILSFVVWILTAVVDMQTISFATSVLFLWALLVALVEICIEREVGWALLAPTWHVHNVVYAAIMSGKDLTGYHLFMFVLPFVLLHLPFAFGHYWGGLKWTLAKEVEILAIYFVTCVCWDFLWFVLNPSFTLERFRPGEIWWHEQWVGRIPTDYIGGIAFAILLTAIVRWRWDKGVVKRMGMVFGTFAFFVSMTVFVAPVYHRWDKAMREAHGGLTERWNDLPKAKRERLMRLLEESDKVHVEVGAIGRDLAQCKQLGIGCRNQSPDAGTQQE
jgi:hypothetical protein